MRMGGRRLDFLLVGSLFRASHVLDGAARLLAASQSPQQAVERVAASRCQVAAARSSTLMRFRGWGHCNECNGLETRKRVAFDASKWIGAL
jgi:hypothetical protein